jgi:hypothetical protein
MGAPTKSQLPAAIQEEGFCARCDLFPTTTLVWFRWGPGITEAVNVSGVMVCDGCIEAAIRSENMQRRALRSEGQWCSMLKVWEID